MIDPTGCDMHERAKRETTLTLYDGFSFDEPHVRLAGEERIRRSVRVHKDKITPAYRESLLAGRLGRATRRR